MRKLLLFIMLVIGMTAQAQVDNYCLDFTSTDGIVNLGVLKSNTIFANNKDWTLQFWFCPTTWNQKAALVRCGTFSVKLGNENSLVINDGTNHLTLSTTLIAAGKWAQVTIRSSKTDGTTEVVINNSKTFTLDKYLSLMARTNSVWLGGGYNGRIDEVRVFKTILPTDYASFWNNTLNKYCPQWDNLCGYWKMDQSDCPNVVNYIYTPSSTTLSSGTHGTMTEGVQKSLVTDNTNLRYCMTLAYDNINHIANRLSSSSSNQINPDLYGCLANHVAILGGYGTDDGHAYLESNCEECFKQMRSLSGNPEGQKFIVTFHAMSMSDLSGTMSNATKRQTMAEDLIDIINKSWVDGIDIDYEWFYSTAGWQYIADMLKIVRAGAEPGKIISVTPHNVTYAYPTSGFADVDYFEFQQYGPQATHSYYSTFTSYAQAFVNYGYPKDKIMLSYSTTSDNASGQSTVIGYNWNANNIAEDDDHFTYNGYYYAMNSLRQVEQRTIYARDNGFAGIFYWDMCNDVNPSGGTKSMSRQSSMYMNSNVQKKVTAVKTAASLPGEDAAAPTATPDPEDQGEAVAESVQLTSLSELNANRKALNITNTNGLGIIYSNADQQNVWIAESSNSNFSGTIDHDAENALWLVLPYDGKYYLYNVGREQFVDVAAFNVTSQPCTFTASPSALEMTGNGGIFTFRSYGNTDSKSYMCASPQLTEKPVCQWTVDDNGSQWKLTTVPSYNATEAWDAAMKLIDPTYTAIVDIKNSSKGSKGSNGSSSIITDLQGRRLQSIPEHGTFIQNGHVYIR